jgi:hypothetical protein
MKKNNPGVTNKYSNNFGSFFEPCYTAICGISCVALLYGIALCNSALLLKIQ